MNLPGEFELFVRQKKRFSRAPYVTPEVRAHAIVLMMPAEAPC